MHTLTATGFLLWTAYGIGQDQWPLILTNAICLCSRLHPDDDAAVVAQKEGGRRGARSDGKSLTPPD
jgi:hypothetical protein